MVDIFVDKQTTVDQDKVPLLPLARDERVQNSAAVRAMVLCAGAKFTRAIFSPQKNQLIHNGGHANLANSVKKIQLRSIIDEIPLLIAHQIDLFQGQKLCSKMTIGAEISTMLNICFDISFPTLFLGNFTKNFTTMPAIALLQTDVRFSHS